MKYSKVILFSFVIINVAVLSYILWVNKSEKVVYVDLVRLYNEFNFKKDRQKTYDAEKAISTGKLDSLRLQYISVSDAYKKNPDNNNLRQNVEYMAEKYLTAEAYYTERLDSTDQKFNQEVWAKVNTLVNQYGDDHHYDVIIGASGAGSVMYGKKENDITEDVLEYINAKYEGE